MLGDKDATATIAVRDMDVAKDFYEGILGLERAGMEDPGGILYTSGTSRVLVYMSEYAGTNQATAVSWAVGDDVEGVVEALKQRGVTFERYDNLPGTTREGDIHRFGDFKAAWFKDPDGNILNIVNQ